MSPTSGSEAGLSEMSEVTLDGIGPVRVDMTLEEASSAAGRRIIAGVSIGGESPGDCSFAKPDGGPEGLLFMTIDGRIARVDVANREIKTSEGATIGTEESALRRMYPGITSKPHAYTDGRYLIHRPDGGQRAIVFETDGSKVTQFRSGREPEVEAVEGCA
ncbi:MAG TPA: hypothetical protein VI541_01580 [Actinomycetota bacterium]|nr:hypothetical protein [Actinomycetota bacterium]